MISIRFMAASKVLGEETVNESSNASGASNSAGRDGRSGT